MARRLVPGQNWGCLPLVAAVLCTPGLAAGLFSGCRPSVEFCSLALLRPCCCARRAAALGGAGCGGGTGCFSAARGSSAWGFSICRCCLGIFVYKQVSSGGEGGTLARCGRRN